MRVTWNAINALLQSDWSAQHSRRGHENLSRVPRRIFPRGFPPPTCHKRCVHVGKIRLARETTWHVDRAWRGALNELVSSKQIRVEIYHHLRVILMQDDEKEFRFILQQLILYVDNCEPLFANYFRQNYCNRICEWASCFRAKTIVNTNMFVESFHRTLKIIYLNQKQNRRIDLLVHDMVDWVQCCYCDLWIHATCAKDSIQNDGTLDYRCNLCSEDS